MPGAYLSSGVMIVDTGFNATGWANRYEANVHAWREDSGAMLAITITQNTSDFDRFSVNNLNGSVTNSVKLSF
jgi:hypothetical protein